MAEKNESFLQILEEYFSKLRDHQILLGTTERITIPIEWLSTEKIDREVIEQACINLFCKANKQYEKNIKRNREFYKKIDCLEIERTENGVNLIIKARDSGTQTKVKVTSNHGLKGPFYAISEEKLFEQVLYAYNYKSSLEISKQLNFTEEERRRLLREEFKKPEVEKARRADVEAGMLEAARNLTKYYDYMIGYKTKNKSLSGTIQQMKDERDGKKHDGEPVDRVPRKSEIYDIRDRENVLLDMKPIYVVNISNIGEDNTIAKFVYITYIYENPRGKDGYLIIAEPFEGNHNTRVRFVTKEKFDEIQADPKDRFVQLAEQLTEMSTLKCLQSKYTKMFKHTSIEKYREKFRRIVLGEPVENPLEKARYDQIDEIIFDGKQRISLEGIETKIENIAISDSNGIYKAREALYGREQKREESETSTIK